MGDVDRSARPRLAKHVRLKYDSARGQHVLLSPETILVINPTGAAIVELCDGSRTVAQIEAELGARYDNVAEGEVGRYVADLVAKRGMEVDHG